METICKKIDTLVFQYLEEFGQLLACKQLIEDAMKNGYFNLSRARIIMGIDNLSSSQYTERDSIIASTRFSITENPFDVEKQIDQEHADDSIKWFGFFTPGVLKQSQKSFQKSIDLILETCRRQKAIENLRIEIQSLLKEKKSFLTKENVDENKLID